jgi:CheY-like chemotaxis protein
MSGDEHYAALRCCMAFDARDIAFALENTAGVVAVYSAPAPSGVADAITVWVEYETANEKDWWPIAPVHYSLLRFMTHEECARVAFVRTLPPGVAARATPVRLSPSDRSAASARISALVGEVERERAEQERRAAIAAAEARAAARKAAIELCAARTAARLERLRQPAKLLVLSDDDELATVAREAFPDGELLAVNKVKHALDHLRAATFDFVLCDARIAFGEWLLLSVAKRLGLSLQVVVAVNLEERAGAGHGDRRYAACLMKPVDADTLRTVRESVLHCIDPAELLPPDEPPPAATAVSPQPPPRPASIARPLAPSSPVPSPREPTRRARVLVVDDHPTADALGREWSADLHVIVTADPFEALEKVAHDDLDLVACNASLKTSDGQPIYRLLWNARPAIKSRFALIFGPDAMPASVRDSRLRAALPRPVTLDKLAELVSSRPR